MTTIFDINDGNTLKEVASLLKMGKVGVLPCDTIYGLSALANEKSEERIYEIKRRPKAKNFITLMTKEQAISTFDIPKAIVNSWPAPLTAIVKGEDEKTHAIRVPNDNFILSLLEETGPLWSTSVNFSGSPSLLTFEEIYKTFSPLVDFIVRKEDILSSSLPSTIIDCTVHPFKLVRMGAFDASSLI